MTADPERHGLSGTDLLRGTPESLAYIRELAPAAFPEGVPTLDEAAAVADAIWRRLRDHPEGEPVAWDPEDARALRISAAFDRGGLLAAFTEARHAMAPTSGPRVTSYHEEEE